MGEDSEGTRAKTIGGRHGSPTVTVAFPFSSIKTGDEDVRAGVVELAELVAQLAGSADDTARATVTRAASALAARLRDR
jgi:hypothetical protein